MTGELGRLSMARFAALAVGGILLPGLCLRSSHSIPAALAAFALLVTGEVLERTLFFAALCTPGMPKGPQ
jgi:DMSO reductase anchor subunit